MLLRSEIHQIQIVETISNCMGRTCGQLVILVLLVPLVPPPPSTYCIIRTITDQKKQIIWKERA